MNGYHSVLRSASFLRSLLDFDSKTTAHVRAGHCCHCGGPLNKADFFRKPRGVPQELETQPPSPEGEGLEGLRALRLKVAGLAEAGGYEPGSNPFYMVTNDIAAPAHAVYLVRDARLLSV